MRRVPNQGCHELNNWWPEQWCITWFILADLSSLVWLVNCKKLRRNRSRWDETYRRKSNKSGLQYNTVFWSLYPGRNEHTVEKWMISHGHLTQLHVWKSSSVVVDSARYFPDKETSYALQFLWWQSIQIQLSIQPLHQHDASRQALTSGHPSA